MNKTHHLHGPSSSQKKPSEKPQGLSDPNPPNDSQRCDVDGLKKMGRMPTLG